MVAVVDQRIVRTIDLPVEIGIAVVGVLHQHIRRAGVDAVECSKRTGGGTVDGAIEDDTERGEMARIGGGGGGCDSITGPGSVGVTLRDLVGDGREVPAGDVEIVAAQIERPDPVIGAAGNSESIGCDQNRTGR